MIGKRVIIIKKNARFNGRRGTIKKAEQHGKKKTTYYRVENIDGLNPGTSMLFKENQLQVVGDDLHGRMSNR